jgi:hypothetical protein
MRKLLSVVVALLAISLSASADNPYKQYTQNLPFPMPEVSAPAIPENKV